MDDALRRALTPSHATQKTKIWADGKLEMEGERVRLVLDGEHILPAKGWVENRHGTLSSETGSRRE